MEGLNAAASLGITGVDGDPATADASPEPADDAPAVALQDPPAAAAGG